MNSINDEKLPLTNSKTHRRSYHSCSNEGLVEDFEKNTPCPSTEETLGEEHEDQNSRSSTECSEISADKWQKLESDSQHEQKKFLEEFLKKRKIKDELVSSENRNVKRGDHIFHKGTFGPFYYHHLLCTGIEGDKICIIEYNGGFSFSAALRSAATFNPITLPATSNPLTFIELKKKVLTYEWLREKKAKIRKWPEELERFSADEVIQRAESRCENNQCDYHGFSNNCEHFVNWCKCGLNTSLQVKPWYKLFWDVLKGVLYGLIEGLKEYCFSISAGAIMVEIENASVQIQSVVGVTLTPLANLICLAVEIFCALWNGRKYYKLMKEGLISKRQFKINTFGTVCKAVCRFGCGLAGSVIGSAFGPLGSILGAGIGYLVGHIFGLIVAWCFEHGPKIMKKSWIRVKESWKRVKKSCNRVRTRILKAWKGRNQRIKSSREESKNSYRQI